MNQKPSGAYIMASWVALGAGVIGFLVAIWRSQEMELNEKGYYFTVLMLGLFSAISVQKTVRDRLEKIPVTDLYYGVSWMFTIMSVVLMMVGLWNATIDPSEKMMYAFAFLLSMFGVISVQKNVRDSVTLSMSEEDEKKPTPTASPVRTVRPARPVDPGLKK